MDVLSIKKWLKGYYSYGSGYCYGNGYGDGSGSGYGEGSGEGYGYSEGSGEGSGSGSGNRKGSGDGSGEGSGFGSGIGYGHGDGDGPGYGNRSGNGYGYGEGRRNLCKGVSYFCKMPVFNIDGIPTIIKSKLGNVVKGFILQDDFTLKPCYVAKNEEYFAHGETMQDAIEELRNKIFENLDTEETIERFISEFKNVEKIKGSILFEWHHYLTGSCLMGRNEFVKRKGLNLEDDFTVEEFINLCENEFGSEIIEQLKERWDKEKKDK